MNFLDLCLQYLEEKNTGQKWRSVGKRAADEGLQPWCQQNNLTYLCSGAHIESTHARRAENARSDGKACRFKQMAEQADARQHCMTHLSVCPYVLPDNCGLIPPARSFLVVTRRLRFAIRALGLRRNGRRHDFQSSFDQFSRCRRERNVSKNHVDRNVRHNSAEGQQCPRSLAWKKCMQRELCTFPYIPGLSIFSQTRSEQTIFLSIHRSEWSVQCMQST